MANSTGNSTRKAPRYPKEGSHFPKRTPPRAIASNFDGRATL